MTRNQDIAMSIIYRKKDNDKVSVYISACDWLSVYLWEKDKIVKTIEIPSFLSDVEAVKLYDEVIEFMNQNEVIENLDFQQEKEEEMLTSAERETKAIEEVF